MGVKRAELRQILQAEADPRYAAFARSLLPGISTPLLGVRLPQLRALARRLAKEKGLRFLNRPLPRRASFEEIMVAGMLPGYVRGLDGKQRIAAVEKILPRLDNWSLCDSCCNTYRFAAEAREECFAWLRGHALSPGEWTRRFGVVMLLMHHVPDAAWAARVAELLPQVPAGGYYADMAVAWCACEIALRHPALAPALLAEGKLPENTRRLSLRKLRESQRSNKPRL